MARRKKDNRVIELTGLIDIVFLLLVFFLVSFSFTLAGNVSENEIYSAMDLPKTTTDLPPLKEDLLENLMIQIHPDTTEGTITRKTFVLWPAIKDTVQISRWQAVNNALRDSTFAKFPEDFLNLPDEEFQRVAACTLIANSINRYVALQQTYNGSARPLIEVRADQNTEFQIISFILNQGSAHNDVVPQIVIRTVQ